MKIFVKGLIVLGVAVLVGYLWDPTAGAGLNKKGEKIMKQNIINAIYKNGKFHNNHPWRQPGFTQYVEMMWKFLFAGGERTPEQKPPVNIPDMERFQTDSQMQLSSLWLGHSSLLINLDGNKIATDPVLQTRVSLFGPTRYNGDAPLTPEQLPHLDLVLISHNHYDHLNKWTIQKIKDKVKLFIVPLGVGVQLEKWGVNPDKIKEMDWWEEITYNNLTVVFTPTQHFSGRGLRDRDKTLWGSFVVIGPTHKIYFSGDSGYFEGFREIGEKYGPFDATFLECGAYDVRWKHIHMLPEETIQAHLDLKGKILHPIHWGTFNLALHAWNEPMERMVAEATRRNITYVTPVVGEIVQYSNSLPQKFWWRLNERELPVKKQAYQLSSN